MSPKRPNYQRQTTKATQAIQASGAAYSANSANGITHLVHGAYWHLSKNVVGDLALQIALGWARERGIYKKRPFNIDFLNDHVRQHRLQPLLELYSVDLSKDPQHLSQLLAAIHLEAEESGLLLLPHLMLLDNLIWSVKSDKEEDPQNKMYHGSSTTLLYDADRGTDSTARLAFQRINTQNKNFLEALVDNRDRTNVAARATLANCSRSRKHTLLFWWF